ncbi:nicotinate-nucleotide--dimethylbenzimidazole phosphoribosyltransferase [Streptomyces sp. WMMC500]|uniref:nicotinate-nucleotide--dimethylbenzimidazole phosphoribosyltransferase n=1 Tax=Streptomyces sp. WMMC500 TaxID=3015154 RepID=UPI00248B86DF|nr:nicotinate-nucleotide--dimethylbenzimidazole phosphoribosyltransferase [Streptomyces sp. WMMC500]WBB60410.1 nicotinate-nucleotide--dimethylbenzimidazole phosphoribosyltransferase [Streptomyces sp. WMMC500]
MTDTGKLPEGHQPGPDDAAGGHHPAPAADPSATAAPAEAAPAAEGAADDDDFLFLPGAQGAWTDPRLPASAGARTAPPAGGTEPATGGQRRPLHMGPPVPEQAGGVVRSLADRGPAGGSADTHEAVAADAVHATGNEDAAGAGSPAPAGRQAAAAGSEQAGPAGAAAASGAVPEQGAAAPDGAGPEAVAAEPAVDGAAEPGPAAAGGLAPAGQIPQQPVRTPGPPTAGPEYLDVTRVATTRLPGPQLGEIPPAPAGWTTVPHPANGETVARPPHAGGEDSAAAPLPVPADAREAAPASPPSGATAAHGTAEGAGPAANGEPAAAGQDTGATAGQSTAGTPSPAPVDAAQAAVRRAAASAGASLGRGISAHGGSAPPTAGGNGPAEAQAPQNPSPDGQPDVPAAAGTGNGTQTEGGAPAHGAAPHAAPAARPGEGAGTEPAAVPSGPEGPAGGRATDGSVNGTTPHAVPAGRSADDTAARPGAAVPGGQAGDDSPAPAAGPGESAAAARPADGVLLRAVPGDDSAAGTADDGPVLPASNREPGDGSRPRADEPAPRDRTATAAPAAAQANGQPGGNSPVRPGRHGDPAGPEAPAGQHTNATAAHGQPADGARARAANGRAVPGGQPAAPSPKGHRQAPVHGVPASRASSDDAAPAAVHAASGGRRGVSLGVRNGAQETPSGSAGEAAADASSEARPGGDDPQRTAAPVTQIRGRRRRGTAVSAPVTAAATPAHDAQDGNPQDGDPATAGASVPAQGSPHPRPAPADEAPAAASAPAAGTPAPAAAPPAAAPVPAAPAADEPGTPAPDPAAPGFADAERAAVHRVMRERRDIRNGFRSDPVPHEVLLRVLEAAHTAPSVGHSQPWDFVVIRSEETRHRMHELAARQREAYAKSLPKGRAKQFKELKVEAIRDTPVNIVVTADPTRGGRHTLGRHTQPQMAPYSSALAVENLWLAARAEGLGVGWVSFFDERELVRELDLPEHLDVVAYLCLGYVDEFPDEPELVQAGWSKRRPLSWVVHEESYGRRALPGEDPHDLLAETLEGIRPLDAKALGEAWERQKRMTKPAGSLGMLEIISAQLCGLSRKCPPPVPEPAAVAVFAGDHGVHAQGVTPWPQEVTGQMAANFLGGGAVCNSFAAQVGAEVCVVDAGVAAELPATAGLVPRKVRRGTADMTAGPAMTREEALRAVEVGIETARDLVAAGNKALLTGEMGIANTTASAAIIAVFTDSEPAEVTGRGTGIDDETYARKVEAVRRAIEVNRPDPSDPIGVLAGVGGLEHAALVGFILAGSSLRTPVVLDGVSAGAAALVARAVAPEALAACIAGHRSPEPGHAAALTKLGLRPLIDLDLRLGEGTGALLALPLVQSAARAMHEVATFDAAGVTEKG